MTLFRTASPWIHIGALAQGKDIMMDENGLMIALRELGWRGSTAPMVPGTESYWQKKLAVWMLCRQWFPIRDRDAEYYNDVFDYAATSLLKRQQNFLDWSTVSALTSSYSVLLSPLLKDINTQ